MSKYVNKLIMGASVLGMFYLNGCMTNPDANNGNTTTGNSTTVKDGLISKIIDSTDSTNTVKTVRMQRIQLEPDRITWNNTKLVGKDEGFISYSKYGGDGEIGLVFVYGEYLFKAPEGQEVTLFGKEGTLFVGQNYDIQFYRLKPVQNISAEMILEAFDVKSEHFQNIHSDNTNVVGLDGVLNSYTRVTK